MTLTQAPWFRPGSRRAMIGLGLLEAVPEETIVAISRQQPLYMRGKPNYVWNYETGQTVLGRFGWKASQPSVRQQTAAAFSADIGATSFLFPADNCPPAQHQCLTVPSASRCGGQQPCSGKRYTEVTAARLHEITQYLQMLAVPARRNEEALEVQRGEALFTRAQCGVCHSPTLKTGDSPELSLAANITFHPYTDLLLHDMGEALADGRPDYLANGREWRTAPLWSLGLLPTVNSHMNLLHDGRARDVTEAILWHGGQAASSRDLFRSMAKDERAALVKFVESL